MVYYVNSSTGTHTSNIPLNKWVHVSLVVKGSSAEDGLSVYVDGIKRDVKLYNRSDTDQPEVPGDGPLVVAPKETIEWAPDLAVDELIFWNRILSPNEIMMLYQMYQTGNSQTHLQG